MKFWLPVLFFSTLMSSFVYGATDIAFGTLKAVKVYDFSSDKSIRLYFNDDATHTNEECSLVAKITYSKHDKESVDRILSVALSAYMTGKKVRVTSQSGTCEGDFIAIQEVRI